MLYSNTNSLTQVAVAGKTCTVKNNSGTDIIVISSSSSDNSGLKNLYDQTLDLLKTTSSNAVIIKNGANAAITLPIISSDNVLGMALILADAKTLAPLKVEWLGTQDNTSGPDATEVTTADVALMKKAADFYKTLVAYPSAKLSTDFATALKDGDPTVIAAFFANQPDYKEVTLDHVLAYQTYANRFPFIWAGAEESKTYYLYSSDGTTNKFAGMVVLEFKENSFTTVEEAVARFSAMWVSTNGANFTDLFYADGQFVDDVNADSPVFCLTGMFMLRSDITKLDTDSELIAILRGKINNTDLFGYDVKQTKDKNGNYSTLDILLHPIDTNSWLVFLGYLLVGSIGFFLLAKAAGAVAEYIRKIKKLTPAEIAKKNLEIREANRTKMQETLNKFNKKLKIPSDITESLTAIKNEGNKQILSENKSKIIDAITKQQSIYDKIADYINTEALSHVQERLQEMYDDVFDNNSLQLGDKMEGILVDLKQNTSILGDLAKQATENLSAAEVKAIDQSKLDINEMTKKIEANEKIREELLEEEIPEIPVIEE